MGPLPGPSGSMPDDYYDYEPADCQYDYYYDDGTSMPSQAAVVY